MLTLSVPRFYAGVAIGLAKSISERIPSLGPEFSVLLMAVIVLNQLAGPPLFKHALAGIGEGGCRDTPLPHTTSKPKPVMVDPTLGVRYTRT